MPGRIAEEIERLKDLKGGIVLAHSYQPGPIQDIADHVGDSLELSRIAADEAADLVVFCGVRFMAETAKLLSPDSKVVLAAPDASCSLAASMTADAPWRSKQRPGHAAQALIPLKLQKLLRVPG